MIIPIAEASLPAGATVQPRAGHASIVGCESTFGSQLRWSCKIGTEDSSGKGVFTLSYVYGCLLACMYVYLVQCPEWQEKATDPWDHGYGRLLAAVWGQEIKHRVLGKSNTCSERLSHLFRLRVLPFIYPIFPLHFLCFRFSSNPRW